MDNDQLKIKMKYLLVWLVVTNIVLVIVLYRLFFQPLSVEELTAKRINIVGEDNNPRIVLSNEIRQHSGRMFGKDFPKRDRPGGIIFFNNDQVIQILNNEMYKDGEEKIQRGFLISEFPKGAKFFNLHNEYEVIKKIEDKILKRQKTLELLEREGSKKRIYLGKSFNNESGLTLYDKKGTPKIKIYIDSNGEPKIEYAHKGKQMRSLITNNKQ